ELGYVGWSQIRRINFYLGSAGASLRNCDERFFFKISVSFYCIYQVGDQVHPALIVRLDIGPGATDFLFFGCHAVEGAYWPSYEQQQHNTRNNPRDKAFHLINVFGFPKCKTKKGITLAGTGGGWVSCDDF